MQLRKAAANCADLYGSGQTQNRGAVLLSFAQLGFIVCGELPPLQGLLGCSNIILQSGSAGVP